MFIFKLIKQISAISSNLLIGKNNLIRISFFSHFDSFSLCNLMLFLCCCFCYCCCATWREKKKAIKVCFPHSQYEMNSISILTRQGGTFTLAQLERNSPHTVCVTPIATILCFVAHKRTHSLSRKLINQPWIIINKVKWTKKNEYEWINIQMRAMGKDFSYFTIFFRMNLLLNLQFNRRIAFNRKDRRDKLK